MQGDWERCGVCGAKLPRRQLIETPSDQPLGALPPDRSALVSITLYALLVVIGIILVGVICVLLLQLVL